MSDENKTGLAVAVGIGGVAVVGLASYLLGGKPEMPKFGAYKFKSWNPEWVRKLEEASAGFPATFGLYGFPGETFRISESSSYVNDDGTAILYTEKLWPDGHWSDWAKGTREELKREICSAPK